MFSFLLELILGIIIILWWFAQLNMAKVSDLEIHQEIRRRLQEYLQIN